MKKYEIGIMLGGGGVMIGAGLVMIVLSNMWGLLLMLVGLGAMAYGYIKLMKGSGFAPYQGTCNGLNGEGKQQSEVIKENYPVQGEQNANIWQQIEK